MSANHVSCELSCEILIMKYYMNCFNKIYLIHTSFLKWIKVVHYTFHIVRVGEYSRRCSFYTISKMNRCCWHHQYYNY